MFKINDKIQSVSSCRQTASIIAWNQQVHWIPWCHHWQISCLWLVSSLVFLSLLKDNCNILPQQWFQLIKRITRLHLNLMSRAREMNYWRSITFDELFPLYFQTKSIIRFEITSSNLHLQIEAISVIRYFDTDLILSHIWMSSVSQKWIVSRIIFKKNNFI